MESSSSLPSLQSSSPSHDHNLGIHLPLSHFKWISSLHSPDIPIKSRLKEREQFKKVTSIYGFQTAVEIPKFAVLHNLLENNKISRWKAITIAFLVSRG